MDIPARVYEELNRYLPPGKRRVPWVHPMEPPATVEDLQEQFPSLHRSSGVDVAPQGAPRPPLAAR